jgi:hypothetical protein
MYHFASRNSGSDAPRRRTAFSIVGLWILPLGLLSLWLLAGGFTLAALASATAAWRTRPLPVEPVELVREGPRIAMPVAAPVVPATRRCKLARPGRTRPEHVL